MSTKNAAAAPAVVVTGKLVPLTQDQYCRLVERLRGFVAVTGAVANHHRKGVMLGNQVRFADALLQELGEDVHG
jgi:hypothetical protein